MSTGRERQYDLTLDGVPYRVVRDENKTPMWKIHSLPEVSTRVPTMTEEERQMTSWHAGFGYSHMLVPNVYHYCLNADARFGRQIIVGPAVTSITVDTGANITRIFELRGKIYVAGGRDVFLINNATAADAPTVTEKSNGTNPAANVLDVDVFDNLAILAIGETTAMETFTGSAFASATSVFGSYLAKEWFDGDLMLVRGYKNSNQPSIAYIPSGSVITSVGNWTGGPYSVGDVSEATVSTSPITSLGILSGTIFIAKTDGLYYVDIYGNSPRVVPFGNRNANNGTNMLVDSAGLVWCPTTEGFYKYDHLNGTTENVAPGHGLPNSSPIYGRITAQAQYQGWRYAAVYNGTDSYIMCGRNRSSSDAGVGSMTWHGALVKISGATIGDMLISSLYPEDATRPRLYFAVGNDLNFINLPVNGDNPLLDSTYTYASSANVYLPADDWAVPGTNYQLTVIEIENKGLSGSTYIDVFAQLNDGNWGYCGRAETTGSATITLPSTADWRFSRCALRLDITNGSSTSTPIVHSVVARAIRRAAVRDVITTKVYCSDHVNSIFNLPTKLSGSQQLDYLHLLEDDSPVVLKDYWTGSAHSRKVLVQPISGIISQQEDTHSAELLVELELVVVSDTVGETAVYGEGVYGISVYA